MKWDKTWLKQIIDIMWGKRKTEKGQNKTKDQFFWKTFKIKSSLNIYIIKRDITMKFYKI